MNNILRENEAIKAAKKAAKDAAGAAKAAAAPAVSINTGKKPSGPARKVTKQDSINAAKQAAKAAAGAAKAAGSAAVSVKNESRNRSIIRMTESDLHQIIKESVNKILKEVKIDYNRHTHSGRNYDWDSNPRNDRGFGYDERVSYQNTIKEDYIGLMKRLERLTGSEWHLSPESHYSYSHNQSGYDSYSEDMGDSLTFSTYYGGESNRAETAKKLDLIEKVVQAFFGGNEVSVNYNGKAISVYVTGVGNGWGRNKHIKSHPNSREISYGKDYAGYPKPKDDSIKGYNHPYPNPHNDGGNHQLANWERFLSGQKPMSYDEWSGRGGKYNDDGDYEPDDWYERWEHGDFDEY